MNFLTWSQLFPKLVGVGVRENYPRQNGPSIESLNSLVGGCNPVEKSVRTGFASQLKGVKQDSDTT